MDTQKGNNVFEDFGIDIAFFEEEKQHHVRSFFENIDWEQFSSNIKDDIQNALKSGKVDITIPKEVVDALKKGKEYFEKFKTTKLPKIDFKSSDGTILKSIELENYKKILSSMKSSSCLYALAAFAILYAFNDAINGIYERINSVLRGQHNDRIGKCLSAVNSYNVLNDADAARDSYKELNEGLTQLHCELREDALVISKMPENDLESFWKGLFHPFDFKPKENDKKVMMFFNSLLAYGTFLSFEDLLLLKISPEEASTRIEENHKKYEKMLSGFESNYQLKKRLLYITKGDMPRLYDMLQSNETMSKILSLNS